MPWELMNAVAGIVVPNASSSPSLRACSHCALDSCIPFQCRQSLQDLSFTQGCWCSIEFAKETGFISNVGSLFIRFAGLNICTCVLSVLLARLLFSVFCQWILKLCNAIQLCNALPQLCNSIFKPGIWKPLSLFQCLLTTTILDSFWRSIERRRWFSRKHEAVMLPCS